MSSVVEVDKVRRGGRVMHTASVADRTSDQANNKDTFRKTNTAA